jgi:ribosomal protein L14
MSLAAALLLSLMLSTQSDGSRPASPDPPGKAVNSPSVDLNAQALAEMLAAEETSVRVELTKSVDAKKAKVGDEISAELKENLVSNGKVIVPKGSRIEGRVVSVQRQQKKDDGSELALAFDRAILRNGQHLPLAMSIKAVGAPVQGHISNWGASPGATSTSAEGTAPHPNYRDGVAPVTVVQNRLADNAQGVWGLPNLGLREGTPEKSVISSSRHNVQLRSGTQLVLRVRIGPQADDPQPR